MRYLFARLKGYAGIYNGLGLLEITIDFSKCINKVTLISGKNGCGKSTLLNSLSILPDSSSSFLSTSAAEKELKIMDNANIYEIFITTPLTNKGHGQTKAYIKKNGTELNPNGNISSYKETIFSEFELDPSYIALSKITGNDRGIADKSPSERKKFISNIIDCLDVYNSMNKVLTKKSNIFKSYMNNLSGKIKGIGDENVLLKTISDIENRYKNLTNAKKYLEKENDQAEAFIKVVDPDGLIQNKYSILYKEISEKGDRIKEIKSKLEKEDIEINDDLEKDIHSLTNNIDVMNNTMKNNNDKLVELISSREELIIELENKKQKRINLTDDFDISSLQVSIKKLKEVIKNQESIFNRFNVTDFNVSKDEFIFIFSKLHSLKDNVQTYKSLYSNIDFAVDSVLKGVDSSELNIEGDKILSKIKSLKERNENINLELERIKSDIDHMDILSSRPSNCKIDSCPLIVNALDIKKTNPKKRLDKLEAEKYNNELDIQKYEAEYESIYDKYNALSNLYILLEKIEKDKPIISKVAISYIFTDTNEFLNRLKNSNQFNEIIDNDSYLEKAEEIDLYRDNKELLIKLESDLKVKSNKIDTLKDLDKEIEKATNKLESINDSMEKIRKAIDFDSSILIQNNTKLSSMISVLDLYKEMNKLNEERDKHLEEYHTIKSNLEKIKKYIDLINENNSKLDRIDADIIPLEDQKKVIEHSLISLNEYKIEYEKYKEKFNVTDTLKKYSSPTKDGIQNLFINIYMSKTLSTANQILSMLFDGEYSLLPYIINSSEFRMPFIGSGMEVDDISSGSTSQVCMMGMIMNLVLLMQASSKFNIVELDEIDGGLDFRNKYGFVDVLYKVIDILGIDQVIMISHSLEADMSNVDVIKLKTYEEFSSEGNIIYEYK